MLGRILPGASALVRAKTLEETIQPSPDHAEQKAFETMPRLRKQIDNVSEVAQKPYDRHSNRKVKFYSIF